MGNYASTEQTNDVGSHYGVDTRPIDKESQKKVIERLERILGENREPTNIPHTENSQNVDESQDVQSEVQEVQEVQSEVQEVQEVQSEKPRVKVDQTDLLHALLQNEKDNAEQVLTELTKKLEETEKTHKLNASVLRTLIHQRDEEISRTRSEVTRIMNDIDRLEKENDNLTKSVEKWRNFYLQASFTNTSAECQKCKNASTKPKFNFGQPRSGFNARTKFGAQKARHVYNVNGSRVNYSFGDDWIKNTNPNINAQTDNKIDWSSDWNNDWNKNIVNTGVNFTNSRNSGKIIEF
jgi:hypothetical protein